MPPDLLYQRFSSGEACRAAGIDSVTFKNWISRDPPAILLSQGDRDARDGRGTFSFSFNRVMQIALCAELVGLGFAPRQAGMLATSFTDVGEGTSGWVGEGEPKAVRLPGALYDTGYTILVAHRGSAHAEVKRVEPREAWDPFWDQAGGFQPSAAVVNVNRLMWGALARLGLDRNGQPLPA